MRHNPAPKQTGKAFYYMYGKHAVLSALNNKHRTIKEVLCTKDVFGQYESLITRFSHEIVKPDAINNLLNLKCNHQGIIAKVKTIFHSDIRELDFNKKECKIAILDQITDPQNIGSIIRSAAAFDISAIIMPADNSPDENAGLAKTASGCLELVPIVKVTNLKSSIDYLKKAGFWVVGLDSNTTQVFNKTMASDRLAIVLGSEDTGPRRLTKESCDFLARIPMSGKVESLNVSNAAAIVFYVLY